MKLISTHCRDGLLQRQLVAIGASIHCRIVRMIDVKSQTINREPLKKPWWQTKNHLGEWQNSSDPEKMEELYKNIS